MHTVATIEMLPHGLSDELLQKTSIKSIKSKIFEINLQKVGTYSARPVSWLIK